jgi:FMN reductase
MIAYDSIYEFRRSTNFAVGDRLDIALDWILKQAQEKRAMKTARLQLSPLIVAIGGTTRTNSSTEYALGLALKGIASEGARVLLLGGADLDIPVYAPERPERSEKAKRLVSALHDADGILIGSPGYHGGLSGLVKNALDYAEDLRNDAAPYFEGRPVGCIVTAAGWQGSMTTLTSMRSIVHALRGWPTPLGVCINTATPVFDEDGCCVCEKAASQLSELGKQVLWFARETRTLGSQNSAALATPHAASNAATGQF